MTPIQQIKAAIRCDDYIARYLEVKNNKSLCPVHNEKTPSLVLHDTWARCFGCGWHCDIISFAREYHGISTGDAIRMLAEEAGVQLTHQPAPHPYDAARAARTAAECEEWHRQTRAALLASLHTDDYDRILPFLTALESMTRSQLLAAYLAQRTVEQGSLLRESVRESDLWCKAITPLLSGLIDRMAGQSL